MSTYPQLPIANDPPPERADAARNRARVLAAARHLFAERDPCDVTVDAVADAAGVGKGTVYRRFGDRAGLVEAVLDDRERAFQAAVLRGPPPLGPGAPPAERLEAFLAALVMQLEEVGDLRAEIEAGSTWPGNAPHRFRRLHVQILLEQAADDIDAPLLADALLAPLATNIYRYQRRVVGHSAERITGAMRTLARGVLGCAGS